MKKSVLLLVVACLSLLSCSKNDPDTPAEQKSTPAVVFSYSQNEVAKDGMTMVLTVDGTEYTFDKESGEQTIYLAATSGTIKFDCTVDNTKSYTTKQDVSISVKISAVSIAADGKSYSAIRSIVSHSIVLKGVQADYVTTSLQANANIMKSDKSYSVDTKGIITIQ